MKQEELNQKFRKERILKMVYLFCREDEVINGFDYSGAGYGIEPEFNLSFPKIVCTGNIDFSRDIGDLLKDFGVHGDLLKVFGGQDA